MHFYNKTIQLDYNNNRYSKYRNLNTDFFGGEEGDINHLL